MDGHWISLRTNRKAKQNKNNNNKMLFKGIGVLSSRSWEFPWPSFRRRKTTETRPARELKVIAVFNIASKRSWVKLFNNLPKIKALEYIQSCPRSNGESQSCFSLRLTISSLSHFNMVYLVPIFHIPTKHIFSGKKSFWWPNYLHHFFNASQILIKLNQVGVMTRYDLEIKINNRQ